MIKTFTQNDVIRFIYDEVTEEERVDILNALITDNELADFYYSIVQVKEDMSSIARQPSDAVIENILRFSRDVSFETAS